MSVHTITPCIKVSLEVFKFSAPEEVPVHNRVVDEAGEEKEEKRNNFSGLIQNDKETSVDTELQDSERTSQLLSLIHISFDCFI